MSKLFISMKVNGGHIHGAFKEMSDTVIFFIFNDK